MGTGRAPGWTAIPSDVAVWTDRPASSGVLSNLSANALGHGVGDVEVHRPVEGDGAAVDGRV